MTQNVRLGFLFVFQLKALTNSNLNVFVGASITLPGISLYWQYCIKGSLLVSLNLNKKTLLVIIIIIIIITNFYSANIFENSSENPSTNYRMHWKLGKLGREKQV